jgi:hypothetical protein
MIPLLNIALLAIFVIIIYAIVGLELFCGLMHSRCEYKVEKTLNQISIDATSLEEWKPVFPIDIPCVNAPKNLSKGFTCPEHVFREGMMRQVECRAGWPGPFHGIINFDNIGYSMLTVFQSVTMEGWTTILYRVYISKL